MTNRLPQLSSTDTDLTRVAISPYTRLRGMAVTAGRRHLGVPLRRHFPTDVFRIYHRFRRRVAPSRYIDGNPFEVFEVDPHLIEYSVLARSPKRPQWGRIAAGEWDREVEPFDERLVPRAIMQRFDDGMEWDQTDLVEAFTRDLRRFGAAWNYRSISGFDSRCREIDRLYRNIATSGYRTQRSFGYTPLDEINVDIDRDGRPVWRCYGQHRLAIAKLLDIDRVPVIVPRRHAAGVDDTLLEPSR